MRVVLTLVFSCLVISSSAIAGDEPIVTSDLLRIRYVTSIDVAQDGTRAVFAVQSIGNVPNEDASDDLKKPEYKNQSHVYVVDVDDPVNSARQLTFGNVRDAAPSLSPDGQSVVFVRVVDMAQDEKASEERDAPAPNQVWIIPVDEGEARQVTAFEHGCENPIWAPNGLQLLVGSPIPLDQLDGEPPWPMERPRRNWKDAIAPEGIVPNPDGSREEIRTWLERNANESNPFVINRLHFQDEHELHGPVKFGQLYLVDVTEQGEPLTQDVAMQLTHEFYDHDEAVFMPDGDRILYVSKKPRTVHPDRVLEKTIWQIQSDGTRDREIIAIDGWSVSSPKVARDGSAIAFLAAQTDEPAFRPSIVTVAAIADGNVEQPVWLTDESMDSYHISWLDDPSSIIFTSNRSGGTPLFTVGPGLIEPAALVSERDGLPCGVNRIGSAGITIVYSQTTVSNPCVLRVRIGNEDREVYDLNPWVKEKALSIPRSNSITRNDGTSVQYWVMEPTHRDPSMKYPLALEIHGGPSAMWGPGEFTMWHEFQLLCSWGYGVVYCNPRGSGGYGYEFMRANYQDWGKGPTSDVLAVLDQVVRDESWIDPNRMVVTGGSYAGYLTAWIVAHDHRFKAAVAQRGVYDFDTFFGEGNAWQLVEWAMGVIPFDSDYREIIDRNNPFQYVHQIQTPLLLMHGSNDLRTGVSQSEMMYRALKRLGKDVEYVRYPNAGHDLSRTGDPYQRMDRLNRIVEFFERFIENPQLAPGESDSQ